VEINKLEFAPRGDHYERELKLVLPPLQQPNATAPRPVEPPPAPVADPQPTPTPSTRPGHRSSSASEPTAVPPSSPATNGSQASSPTATPAANGAQPFGAPVLPDRPRAMPPLGAPLSTPGGAGPAPASAAGSLTVTPSAATGSLATVTSEPARGDPLKRATECLLRGDNACVIRELEQNARSAPELEMLIETYRATGDQRGAERHMSRYVNGYPTARRAAEYRRMLQRTGVSTGAGTTPANMSPAPGASTSTDTSAGGGTTAPAAPMPKNPPAPPMAPDPP
jgi:hypothetical protein